MYGLQFTRNEEKICGSPYKDRLQANSFYNVMKTKFTLVYYLKLNQFELTGLYNIKANRITQNFEDFIDSYLVLNFNIT